MEEIKAWLYPLATAVGLGAVWGDLKRRLGNIEKRQQDHDRDHRDARYISQDGLDRTQAACRSEWKGLLHNIENALSEIKSDIKDVRDDIKDVRKQQ